MLLQHRVSHTSNLDLHGLIIKPSHNREVLLYAGLYCSRNEFLHPLSTAYYRNLLIYNLLYNIAAMRAFIKFRCHSLLF